MVWLSTGIVTLWRVSLVPDMSFHETDADHHQTYRTIGLVELPAESIRRARGETPCFARNPSLL